MSSDHVGARHGLATREIERAVEVAVLIPCKDEAPTIGGVVAAFRRALPDATIWVCDNGSTDDTVAVATSWADRIPGLRVVDASAVRGAGAARNVGAEQARGAWLAFCDADDEVAGDWLATMCAALAEHRFVAGRFEARRLNDARVLRSRPMEQQGELQSSEIGARLPHAGGGNLGIHRDDFLAVGGFDPAVLWLEDTDFSWRVQLAGVPLVFRPEVVVHVRLRHTLRAMFRQGRHYGVAHAVLERRYGSAGPALAGASPSETAEPLPRPSRSAASAASGALTWLVDHVVGGRLAWRVGWVVGHRSRQAREAAEAAGELARPDGVRLGSA